MCVDNCPEYELPNIITVNGDQVNDVWIPIKNKFVKEVDLHIYNRWGNLIYETTDAAIGWDGKVQQTNKICANGTYYYICEVKMIRYTGIETIKLKGFIEVISNQ
jgi:gliding motility-associated-like protein